MPARVAVLVAAAAVLLAGCKVDARVDVSLRADGSGTVSATVTLDRDATARLGPGGVRLDGLRAAGWSVSRTATSAGGARYRASHGFVGRADLARRLADLAGPGGPLRDPRIIRTRGWFGARDSLSVDVDLTRVAAGVRSDAQLAARLAAAGVDVDALDSRLSHDLRGALALTVVVRVPGARPSAVHLRAGDRATVSASRSQTYSRRIGLLAAGGGLLLVALVLMAVSLRSRSRPRPES